MYLTYVLFIYFVCIIVEIVSNNLTTGHFSLSYKNEYGDGYGTEWIYFPDGQGVPHYVNLSATSTQPELKTDFVELEFRRYKRNVDHYIVMDAYGNVVTENLKEDNLFKNSIKIITHGWKSSIDSPAVKVIKEAYLETKDADIITIDWSVTADSFFYNWVANKTKNIGEQVAIFLDGLSKQHNVSGDQIHLIGHSLGAHVMGVAAYKSNLTINRITGLDPARPLFEYPSRDDSEKLDSSDAKFVDVIHTCGGVLGIEAAIGTADFYPNSGIPPQPGCDSIQKILEACSHSRAHDYFAESIKTPKAFPAFKCASWLDYLQNLCDQYGFMGEDVNRNVTGKLYLKTNAKQPFGRSFEPFCLFG
ncbi:phospholipase A1 [Bombyx mori]